MEKKKEFYKKKWFIILIGFIVIMMVVSAANGGSNNTGNNSEPSSSNEKTTETKKDTYTQSETAVLDDVEYKVTKVEKSSGSQFDKPKSGYEYVVVTLQIDNKSDKTISYNPLNFKMSNSKGQVTSTVISVQDNDTSLSYGDLTTGGTISGTMVFEQPVDDKELSLGYYGGFGDKPDFQILLD